MQTTSTPPLATLPSSAPEAVCRCGYRRDQHGIVPAACTTFAYSAGLTGRAVLPKDSKGRKQSTGRARR